MASLRQLFKNHTCMHVCVCFLSVHIDAVTAWQQAEYADSSAPTGMPVGVQDGMDSNCHRNLAGWRSILNNLGLRPTC